MHVRSSAEIDVRAGSLDVEADARCTITRYVGADIKGAVADDVIAGLQSCFAAACPGNATTVDSRGERRAVIEGSVRVVAGSIALLPCGAEVVAGVAVAVGIFDIAGVVVVRRRIDVDVAFLAVGTNDVDALAVVTFHIGNRRRAVSFHGTFGAGSDLDAAVRRRNRTGAENLKGLRMIPKSAL